MYSFFRASGKASVADLEDDAVDEADEKEDEEDDDESERYGN